MSTPKLNEDNFMKSEHRQCGDCKLFSEQGVYWHPQHHSFCLKYGACLHWLEKYKEDAKRLGITDDMPNRCARRVEWDNCDYCEFYQPKHHYDNFAKVEQEIKNYIGYADLRRGINAEEREKIEFADKVCKALESLIEILNGIEE